VRTVKNGKGGKVVLNTLNRKERFVRIYSYQGDDNYGISLFEVQIYGDWSDGSCTSAPTNCDETQAIIEIDFESASASSQERDLSADKAIAGDMNSRWSSVPKDDEWFAVDLGQPMLLNQVQLHWESAYALSYELQVPSSVKGE
jgi:hypothetical protein